MFRNQVLCLLVAFNLILCVLGYRCENGYEAFVNEYQGVLCINPSVNVFCRGVIVYVHNANEYYCSDCGVLRNNQGCCGDKVYNKTTHICCGGHVVNGNIYRCCLGQKVKKNTTQSCVAAKCSGTSRDELGKHDFACCNGLVYNRTTHTCCGDMVVSSSNHLCCSDTPVRKINPEADLKCCGTQAYEPQKFFRCEKLVGRLVPKDAAPLCGHSFLQEGQQCCVNNVQPLYDDKSPEKRLCCGIYSYHNSTQSCFNGVVSPKRIQQLQVQNKCGEELYDPANQLCCTNMLHDKYDTTGEAMSCGCGVHAINPRTHGCRLWLPFPRSSVAEEPDCPIKKTNATDLLTRPFVAVRTVKRKLKAKFTIRNVTLVGSKIRCKKQKKFSIKAAEGCSQFRDALKSGETLIIANLAESNDELVLSKEHTWAVSSKQSWKNVCRHARNLWRRL